VKISPHAAVVREKDGQLGMASGSHQAFGDILKPLIHKRFKNLAKADPGGRDEIRGASFAPLLSGLSQVRSTWR